MANLTFVEWHDDILWTCPECGYSRSSLLAELVFCPNSGRSFAARVKPDVPAYTHREKVILIQELPKPKKTKIFAVVPTQGSGSLGVIKWFSHWRRYVFHPGGDTLYDASCLREIADFLNELMIGRNPALRYQKEFGDNRECKCGHPYSRHFDWMEMDRPDYVPSCKYCGCGHFKEKK